jgi:hypothetical protein
VAIGFAAGRIPLARVVVQHMRVDIFTVQIRRKEVTSPYGITRVATLRCG